jgi:hypothetical protein
MTASDRPLLSRRRLLGALGTVGVGVGAAAGVGLGTTGYLSDDERYASAVAAGRLDLRVGFRSTYNGATLDAAPVPAGADPDAESVACDDPGLVDGDGVPAVDLADVKPGDCGSVSASLHVCANPSRLWMAVALLDAAENDLRPEERLAGDGTPDAGELDELIEVTCWVDADGDGAVGPDERLLYEGTLAGLATAAAGGLLVTADGSAEPTCAAAGTATTVALAWCLPLDGPGHNRAITDAVTFDLRFGAVQCRHDEAGWNPFADPAADAAGDAPVGEGDPAT